MRSAVQGKPIRHPPPTSSTAVHSQLSLVTRVICNCEHGITQGHAGDMSVTSAKSLGPSLISTSWCFVTSLERQFQLFSVYLGFWKNLFASCLPPPCPLAIGLLRNIFYLYIFISEEKLLTRLLFSTHKQEDCEIA